MAALTDDSYQHKAEPADKDGELDKAHKQRQRAQHHGNVFRSRCLSQPLAIRCGHMAYQYDLADHETEDGCRADLDVLDRPEKAVNQTTDVRRVEPVLDRQFGQRGIGQRLRHEREGHRQA